MSAWLEREMGEDDYESSDDDDPRTTVRDRQAAMPVFSIQPQSRKKNAKKGKKAAASVRTAAVGSHSVQMGAFGVRLCPLEEDAQNNMTETEYEKYLSERKTLAELFEKESGRRPAKTIVAVAKAMVGVLLKNIRVVDC